MDAKQLKRELRRAQAKRVAKAVALGTLVVGGAAMAQTSGLDVSAATTELSGEVTTNIEKVGGGIFTLSAIAMGISWIKATFFG